VVTGWLGGDSAISAHLRLLVATARLTEGDPVPTEHDAVRWLRADQLDDVAWADADVAFLAPLRDLVGAS
jgi:8-oxo-dGTP diphosphatase